MSGPPSDQDNGKSESLRDVVVDFEAAREQARREEEQKSNERLILDLDGFEGPLDVLLALARNQKVDLTQISILQLAEQYLAFIETVRRLELDLAADYLVMAAWLAYLKSRLLLPPPEDETEEGPTGEELAQILAFRLQRLEAMRKASADLMKRDRLGRQVFARGAPEGVRVTRSSTYSATLYDLLKSYSDQRVRSLRENWRPPPMPIFPIEEARKRLEGLLGTMLDWRTIETFMPEGFSGRKERRSALASTLSAALELARDGEVEIVQDDVFGPVLVRRRREERKDGPSSDAES